MIAQPVSAETVDATFEARELLLAMLGAADTAMHHRVRRVVQHAELAPVRLGAPPSPDDEVLTVSFERVFTRAEVATILDELRSVSA